MKPLCLTVICLVLMHALPHATIGDAILMFIIGILFAFLICGVSNGKG